jgi:group II intron reverse transcriptase/maturase
MAESPNFTKVSTKLRRIAQLAKEDSKRAFKSLAHHIDMDLLLEAHRLTRKDGAVGVDGQTAEDYAADLEKNLGDLLGRFKSGTYHAPPVRRVHIPKGDGKTRPLGIPTFEDKILQRAVAMVLEAVYEQDFLPCSWGFRPGRSAHGALREIHKGLRAMGGGWVLDVDIKAYFDSLDHGKLREILDQRVRDGVLRRVIDKWLKAGVLEKGELHYPEEGTPQGGVISPLLANVYLHEVLDTWFSREVQPRMRGAAFLVRYADDFIMAFSCEEDARRVLDVLPKRFERFGLTVHPEKTRLVRFDRPGASSNGGDSGRSDEQTPGSFDFLGFTHLWVRSRRGYWMIHRKTARKRFLRGLKAIAEWCRENLHQRIADQRAMLTAKLRGHYQYYGLRGNYDSLGRFLTLVTWIWKRSLERRSQKGCFSWERFKATCRGQLLPRPRLRADAFT